MKTIEDGLQVHNGHACGPLADAAARRAERTGARLDEIGERAGTLTDAELFAAVADALRHFTQRAPRAGQVQALVRQIRQSGPVAWDFTGRLPCA
ncbi:MULTISPECIES: hypothetical protein [Streptomyces]|uniref:Uncharacterized protein n=1 Tax=Streptomyces zinciresistens K42 TaxID=700597 RepID=G2GDF0_9ACTN|nr:MULTISPECIES: hypothetical protein [Streptomyces]EGX58482.1 hypothetical protein SZN_17637 [Streptomyces zinciresistens K42]MDT9695820.1 hypothetical protein [Streptomyces sp. P17]